MSKDLGPEPISPQQRIRDAIRKAAEETARTEAQEVVDGLRTELNKDPKE